MIVLISGAKKNVGDYLIVDRAKQLLMEFVDPEVILLNRFSEISLDDLNAGDAIVLGGGPAYAADIFPGVFKFIDKYDKTLPPIIPMGLGWSGEHANDISKFKFTSTSQFFLEKIHSRIKYSSCRDNLTKTILDRHGFKNSVMTGCPVWYKVDQIGRTYSYKKINRIVITTGASQKLVRQTLSIVKMIRRYFPKAEIILSYHRGILPGKNTPPRKGISYSAIALLAQRFNVTVKDVSGDVNNIEFYKNCDLHIGYRVHAHLYFLSYRIPSILINEDGRGLGMGLSLGLPIFNVDQHDLLDLLDKQIHDYLEEKFLSFDSTFSFIDSQFLVMKDFLSSVKDK